MENWVGLKGLLGFYLWLRLHTTALNLECLFCSTYFDLSVSTTDACHVAAPLLHIALLYSYKLFWWAWLSWRLAWCEFEAHVTPSWLCFIQDGILFENPGPALLVRTKIFFSMMAGVRAFNREVLRQTVHPWYKWQISHFAILTAPCLSHFSTASHGCSFRKIMNQAFHTNSPKKCITI